MSSDRLERKRRSEIDISDDSADEQPPVKIRKRDSKPSFVKILTETCRNFFKWIAPKFLKNLMIVDSQVCPNMGIADGTKSNCIEDDDEVSIIAEQNGTTGARPKFLSAQRMAMAPISSMPSNSTICTLASAQNSFPLYSPGSSRLTSRAMEHRKTNGYPYRRMETRKVGNQKNFAPITNPKSNMEILLEGTHLENNEVEIVAEVHHSKNSPHVSRKSKSLNYSRLSRREKMDYAERLILETSSRSLPSRSNKSFTALEVLRLREKAQYQLLLEKVMNRNVYSRVVTRKNSSPSSPPIDLTNNDEIDWRYHHFKKEKVEELNEYYNKCYKPCVLVPYSSQNISSLQKTKDSEDDIQVIAEMPKLRPSVSSVPSDLITDEWLDNFRKSIASETEKMLEDMIKTEGVIERFKRRRDAKIAEENRKLDEMRLAGCILPEDVEMEEDVLPEITPEMEAVIARAWGPGQVTEKLCNHHDVQITRSDILTLAGLAWLNDQVINLYLAMISARSKEEGYPSIHIYSSFFYGNLKIKGPPSVLRWTKKIDVFSHDILMVPLHLSLHWALLVVDNRNRTISYYDSMSPSEEKCLYYMRDYLIVEMKAKKNAVLDPNHYSLEIPKDIPKQMNGSDCGMFALKYAEYLSRDKPFTFSQENMPYFRRRMVYELLENKIL